MKANTQLIARINDKVKTAFADLAKAKGSTTSAYLKDLIREELKKNNIELKATA